MEPRDPLLRLVMSASTIVERLIVVIVLLTLATTASAQSSRTEQIAEQQREKARTLGVESPSRGEVIVERVMRSPLLAGSGGLLPVGRQHLQRRRARIGRRVSASLDARSAVQRDWCGNSDRLGDRQRHLVDAVIHVRRDDAAAPRCTGVAARGLALQHHGDRLGARSTAQIDYTPREISFGLNAAVAPRTSLIARFDSGRRTPAAEAQDARHDRDPLPYAHSVSLPRSSLPDSAVCIWGTS
jgi:hypothetical protein